MMLHLYLSPMSCLYNFFHPFTIALLMIVILIVFTSVFVILVIVTMSSFSSSSSFIMSSLSLIINVAMVRLPLFLIFFMLIWSNTPCNFHFRAYQNTALFTLMILSRQKIAFIWKLYSDVHSGSFCWKIKGDIHLKLNASPKNLWPKLI